MAVDIKQLRIDFFLTKIKGMKMTIDDFVRRARLLHGDKYDYSKLVYRNTKERVCIICPIHGDFWQFANNHLRGAGCPRCKGSIISETKKAQFTTELFIEKAKKLFGNKYNYSKVKYINNRTPVIIGCPIHGDFMQMPNVHLNGHGCKACGRIMRQNNNRLSTEEFIKRAFKVHGRNGFDYSMVDYVDTHTPVYIKCAKGHIFRQKPCDHLHGHACPVCNESRGEKDIEDYLKARGFRVEACNAVTVCGNLIVSCLHELENFIYLTLGKELIEE